ncbi:PEP-CTERM sorting domain-containing protein, partial [Akkermansiaceae bacterium]|nr:PEP-CTERM sorting domain-containing protein [Akkermansiaceae bacterium]
DQLITFGNEPGDTSKNVAFHEGQVQRGDSGAPLFRVASGDLEIVGINWAVIPLLDGNFVDTSATPEPLEERNASYYSYVGSYESQINSTISNVPAATPEPNSMGLISLASIFAYRRRR